MKKIILFLLFVAPLLHATPITDAPVTISSPKVGQSPIVHVFTSATPFYRMVWGTMVVSGNPTNFLMSFGNPPGIPQAGTWRMGGNAYAATTYAEMKTEATALGITNLPAQVSGQP